MEQKTKNEKSVWEKKTKITVLILNIVVTMTSAWVLIPNWQRLTVLFEISTACGVFPIAFVVFGWLGFFLQRRDFIQASATAGIFVCLMVAQIVNFAIGLVLLAATIWYFCLLKSKIRSLVAETNWTQRFSEKVRIFNWVVTIVTVLLCWVLFASVERSIAELSSQAQELQDHQILSQFGIALAGGMLAVMLVYIFTYMGMILWVAWLGYIFKRRGLLRLTAILAIPIWPISIVYFIFLKKNPKEEAEEVALTELEHRMISREKDDIQASDLNNMAGMGSFGSYGAPMVPPIYHDKKDS